MLRAVPPKVARRIAGFGVAAAVPYVAVKTYWAAGGRAGLPDGFDMSDEFRENGAPEAVVWLVEHGVDFTAVAAVCGMVLVSALVRPWGRVFPRWLLLVPACAGTALLIPYGLLTSVLSVVQLGEESHSGVPGMTQWIVPAGVAAFLGLGVAMGAGVWSQVGGKPLARRAEGGARSARG
ncbi:hypothetical protein ACQUSR_30840 [Streptomyces sp. P1-3]|uniref:hypothetical protein n=1 Tax=Streptomyces sp. P1-3 TaxID=3421658 RepID=UPI003D365746